MKIDKLSISIDGHNKNQTNSYKSYYKPNDHWVNLFVNNISVKKNIISNFYFTCIFKINSLLTYKKLISHCFSCVQFSLLTSEHFDTYVSILLVNLMKIRIKRVFIKLNVILWATSINTSPIRHYAKV